MQSISKCVQKKDAHLIDLWPLSCETIPENNSSLIVAAGQQILVIATPADTAKENVGT